jgi:hypothetical protein
MAIPIPTNFDIGTTYPIDNRMVVADINARNSISQKYQGMLVFVTATQELWCLKDTTPTWVKITQTTDLPTNSSYVDLSTNQTIAGTKTFSSPIVGSVNGNAGTVTNGVYTAGDQTIAGTKTFSSAPVCNAGVDLANQTMIKAVPGIVSTSIAPSLTDANHNGRVIYMTNTSSQTITIPFGLSAGFNCTVVQGGVGAVAITTAQNVTLNGYLAAKTLAGQYAAASILATSSNNYIIYGNTV